MPAIEQHTNRADADPAPALHNPDPALRVLVVDDHPAVRMGLRELFEDQPDFLVVDAVESADAAMALAEREPIDVAVVDYQLGSRNGLWLSRKLKRLPRPPRVVIYSAYCDGPLAATSVVAEADGLVSKGGIGADLCEAVRAVAHGQVRLPTVPPALATALRRRLDAEEQAIFGMLLAGIPAAEIAIMLGISSAGLESRLWTMLRKLEALQSDSTGVRRSRPHNGRRRGSTM
jgi:DNA-binding NarL/FixJ family response regulator